MQLKKLFSPIEINGMTIKNRIVMAPMGLNLENIDGSVSEALIDYFEARARGGTGLIISPFTAVNEEQRAASLGVYSDRLIPGLNRLCERVQAFGSRFLLQIAHPGGKVMMSITGEKPVAPSSIVSPIYFEQPRELTVEEIEYLVEEFARAAERAQVAGFDGVEVHGAHTYLIGEFISPHTNKRQDGYGGTFEKRMLFPSKIVGEIKKRCGDGFIVGFKFSAHEELEGGVDLELAKQIAVYMEKQGVHYVHVASTSSIPGLLEVVSEFPSDPSIYSPHGVLVKLAEGIKGVVSIPVIAAGGITDPVYAEQVIMEERADLVALGRALLADPAWPLKANKCGEIKYCIKCNTCHNRLWNKKRVKCTVNPALGEEHRFQMRKAPSQKRIIVIGAGPSGMEASITASQRGHKIILYEKKEILGGNLVYGSIPSFKQELRKLLNYYQNSIERSKIEVRLGKEVISGEELLEDKPDAIILALGAEQVIPQIPNIDRENVLNVIQVYDNKDVIRGKEICIIGAGLVGCETGWYLAAQGKSVKLVDTLSKDEILRDEHPANRIALLKNMEREGVVFFEKSTATKIVDAGLMVQNEYGEEKFISAENIIIATGFECRKRLKDKLIRRFPDISIYMVGDCAEPRKLFEAIHEGFYTAWQI